MRKVVLGFAMLSSLIACGGETVGVSLHAVTGSSPAPVGTPVQDDAGTAFTLTSAIVNVRDIELDLPDGRGCDDTEAATCQDRSIKIVGPFVIDLLAGTSTPSLADVRVPAGVYKRIDFRIDDGEPGSALAGTSMVASAAFQSEGQAMTLDLSLRFNEDIRIEDPAGVDVSGDAQTLLAKFDAGAWLSGLDIGECLQRGELAISGSVVTVDEETSGTGSCSEIENVLKLNIKTAAQLDRD